MADRMTRRLLNLVLGLSRPTLALYPGTAAGATVPGQTLPAGAGPGWGAWTDIIGAATVPVSPTIEFYLLQIQYDSAGGAIQIFSVEIQNLTLATLVFQDRIDITAKTVNLGPTDFPVPVYCNPNNVIQGRVGDTPGKTLNVSLLVATGI